MDQDISIGKDVGDKSRWPTFLIQEGGLGLQEVGQGAADCPIFVDLHPGYAPLFELGDDLVGDLLVQAGSVREGLVGRCRVGHGRVSAAGGRKPLSRLLHPSRTRHRPFPSNSIRWASERPRRSSHHTMSTPRRGPRGSVGALTARVRFARDSPLEGDGFEPSVPRQRKPLVEAASFARDRNRERTSGANVTCSGRGSVPIAAPTPALPQSGLTRDYYAGALVGATEVAQGVRPQIASASLDDLGDDGKRNFGRLDAVNVEAFWRLQARQAILG